MKFAFIFVKKKSLRLKNKNIKKLKGKYLFEHSIILAKKVKRFKKIFISTDSNFIANYSKKKYGIEVIKRPSRLSKPNSKELDVWKHAIKFVEKKYGFFDSLTSLPATSPLRNLSDVNKCINLLKNDTDLVVTVKKAERNPYFNMLKKIGNFYKLVLDKKKSYSGHMEFNNIYDMTTVCYCGKVSYIKKTDYLLKGKIKAVYIPFPRSIDIDEKKDIEIANLYFKKI